MIVRVGVVLCSLLIATPLVAQEMRADQARRFVVGKLFSYSCFEGTSGAGRISPDGSASGTVQFQGKGPVRYVALPANTLRVKGDAVCASVRGMPFEPCFNLVQTDAYSFRGSISGLGFAYCTFTRRGGRAEFARRNTSHPIQSAGATTRDD